MPEAGCADQAGQGDGDPLAEMSRILHDACQPLTALLCMLEMACDEPNPENAQALAKDALRESQRLRLSIMAMRRLVQAAIRAGEREAGSGDIGHPEKSVRFTHSSAG